MTNLERLVHLLTSRLSWWPNCNWCTKGTNHLANPSSDNGGDGDGDGDDTDDTDDTNTGTDPYADSGDDDDDDTDLRRRAAAAPHGHTTTFSAPAKRQIFGTHHRMRKWQAAVAGPEIQEREELAARQDPANGELPSVTLPTDSLLPTTQTTSSVGTMMGTPAPAEAPAKTQTTKKSSSASCTPSPTKSLAPSASASSRLLCPSHYRR